MLKMNRRYHKLVKILLPLIFLLVFAFSITKIYDYDLWWHLKSGEEILKSFKIQYVDHFSITTEGKEWIDVHWLSQILFYAIFSVAGFTGMQLLVFCAVALSIFSLYRIRSDKSLYSLTFLFLIYLAIYASKDRYLPRPDIFTLLFPALYCLILYRFQFQNKKIIYLLPILQILWVNMHGSFILGPLLIFSFTAAQFLNLIFSRFLQHKETPGEKNLNNAARAPIAEKRKKFYQLFIILILILAVNLINPYGFKIFTLFETYLVSFHSFLSNAPKIISPVTIQEWLPTFSTAAVKYYHTFFPFYLALMILGFFSFFLNVRRFSFHLFFVFSGFFLLSIFAIRNVSVFSLISTTITAHNVLEFGSSFDWKKYHRKHAKSLLLLIFFIPFLILLLFSVFDVFSNRYYIRHHLPMETNFGVSRYPFPFGAAEFLKKEAIEGHFYNNFESGGFLIWSLYPEHKVFTDGRYIDPEFSRVNLEASQNLRKWEELVTQYDVECALLKFPSQDTSHLITALSHSDRWKIVYLDWNSIIFLKDSARNQKIIKKHALILPDTAERSHLEKDALPFSDHLMDSFIENEINKNPIDRLFCAIASLIEKYQQEPLPIETLNKAYLLRLIGAHEASIDEYLKVVNRFPAYDPAHFELGLLYFELEQYQKSLDEMNRLLERNVNILKTSYYAGLSSYYLNRSKEAARYLEKAVEKNPEDYSAHFFLSLSHLNSGNFSHAEHFMKRAIQIRPNSAEAYFNLGSIYLLRKENHQARLAFQIALEINPSFNEAWEELEKLDR
jgi:hypothetical protein